MIAMKCPACSSHLDVEGGPSAVCPVCESRVVVPLPKPARIRRAPAPPTGAERIGQTAVGVALGILLAPVILFALFVACIFLLLLIGGGMAAL